MEKARRVYSSLVYGHDRRPFSTEPLLYQRALPSLLQVTELPRDKGSLPLSSSSLVHPSSSSPLSSSLEAYSVGQFVYWTPVPIGQSIP